MLSHDEVIEMAGAFVLGALDPAEAEAVRAHLATCPEDHSEIAELGSVLPVIAASVPVVEPSEGLKARIMAAAAADLAERGGAGAQADAEAEAVPAAEVPPATSVPTPFPSESERAARRSGGAGPLSWALRIAAVVAIVTLGASTLLLRNQLNASQAHEQAVSQVLEVAAQPGSLTAVLTPDGGTGSGLAAINAAGDVTLAMQDLAPTSGSTVYTAWVIGGDGVPIDIGSFQVGAGGTASFGAASTSAAADSVLALTREQAPGATTPTMPIISKGVATAPA
ncbi:MAG TPA: anti-sigma factor [Candidatus Limnocylindrales bacterium]